MGAAARLQHATSLPRNADVVPELWHQIQRECDACHRIARTLWRADRMFHELMCDASPCVGMVEMIVCLCLSVGVQVCWYVFVPKCWCAGMLVCCLFVGRCDGASPHSLTVHIPRPPSLPVNPHALSTLTCPVVRRAHGPAALAAATAHVAGKRWRIWRCGACCGCLGSATLAGDSEGYRHRGAQDPGRGAQDQGRPCSRATRRLLARRVQGASSLPDVRACVVALRAFKALCVRVQTRSA